MTSNECRSTDTKPRRRWYQFGFGTLLIVVAALAILLGLGRTAWRFVVKEVAREHMKSVTKSLEKWAAEDSQIHCNYDACQAIDMLGYIEDYYVPDDGYRSDAETEAALQSQRKRTMAAIIESLERFTGELYGDDLEKWKAWRQRHKEQTPAPVNGGQR